MYFLMQVVAVKIKTRDVWRGKWKWANSRRATATRHRRRQSNSSYSSSQRQGAPPMATPLRVTRPRATPSTSSPLQPPSSSSKRPRTTPGSCRSNERETRIMSKEDLKVDRVHIRLFAGQGRMDKCFILKHKV